MNDDIFAGIPAEITKNYFNESEKSSISISPSEPYQQLGRILDIKTDELNHLDFRID